MSASLIKDFLGSLRSPDHWLYASWLSVVTSTRRHFLGIFWLVFPVMVYIWGIGWFMAMLNPGKVRPFMAHVGISYVLFRLVVGIVNECSVVYRASAPYINDGKTRYTDYLLSAHARSLFIFFFSFPVVFVALLMSEQFDPAGIPMALVGSLLLIFITFTWAVPISFLGSKLPDFAEFIGNLTMALFLVTPIIWYPAAAPEGTLQGSFMRANPLHHLIAIVRAPLVGESIEPLTWTYLGIMAGSGLMLSVVCYRAFSKKVPMWI